MNAYWLAASTKFDALNPRERYLLAGGILALLYAILHMLLLAPVVKHNQMLRTALASNQSQLQTIRQQMAVYTQQPVIDPDAPNKQRLTALLSRLQLQKTELKAVQAALINPDDIPDLLRSLLKKNSKLKLISLKTLPAQGLLDHALATSNTSDQNGVIAAELPDSKASQDEPVYKHDVEITLEGRYLDLLDYVAALEKMPWHVLWSQAVLQVDEQATTPRPLSQLKLTVYTLSLEHTWLSI